MNGIFTARESEFDALAALWEASVRATHDFLREADIAGLRQRVRHEYLHAVALRVFKNESGHVLGFVGVADGKVEMLFIAPQARGQGIGRQLLRHAVEQMGATALDVNEQNPQAVGFYQRQGFVIVGRSPVDGQGNPFPLLHMRLDAAFKAAPP
ncbi:acetyltransferase [Bordetella petrii]|uniref:Acetyltransferase n=1 Tax=Bordetella petrii TaxID=94624 RepID=A0ABT7W120_9BORD|nr:acetyltransferase [Bordetella petrii]MDM9558896.1 acetyltransferase [Bordetella petrii]